MSARSQLIGRRKDVAWTVLSLLLLHGGLALAIDMRLLDLRQKTSFAYQADQLRDRVMASPGRPFTMAFLGSSRTVFGVRAGRIERPLERMVGRPAVVHNLGRMAAGLFYQYVCFNRLMDSDCRPDLVLVEVVPPDLIAGSKRDANCVRTEPLSPEERTELRRFGIDLPNSDSTHPRVQSPWYQYRSALIHSVLPALLPGNLRGRGRWQPDRHGWLRLEGRGSTKETRKQWESFFSDFRLSSKSCQVLEDILQLAERERVPIALVLMPEHSEFRSWYSNAMRSEVEQFLAGLQQKYGCPIINARVWVDDTHVPDGHHLVVSGATEFTQRFCDRALPKLVERAINLKSQPPPSSTRFATRTSAGSSFRL